MLSASCSWAGNEVQYTLSPKHAGQSGACEVCGHHHQGCDGKTWGRLLTTRSGRRALLGPSREHKWKRPVSCPSEQPPIDLPPALLHYCPPSNKRPQPLSQPVPPFSARAPPPPPPLGLNQCFSALDASSAFLLEDPESKEVQTPGVQSFPGNSSHSLETS